MPAKAGSPAVPRIAKAIGKGYTLTAAQPSGAYDRLAPKDGRTVAWVMPRSNYVRLMFVVDVTGAPKAILKNTVVTKGRVYLKVTEDNIEQARDLIAWAIAKAPAKPPATSKPKATSAEPKPKARKQAASSRTRPSKPKTPVRKRRLEWVMPSGESMARRLPEDEVEGFIEFLKEQGAEGITLE